MSDTPETHEAVERWQQGKINIFDEMARLETERNRALLELGATQAAVAEVLGLTNTPTTADEVRQALRGVVGLAEALVKTIKEMKAERDA